MTAEDLAVLQAFMSEARDDFPDLSTYNIPIKMDDVRDLCIRRMITGDEQALAALPSPCLRSSTRTTASRHKALTRCLDWRASNRTICTRILRICCSCSSATMI